MYGSNLQVSKHFIVARKLVPKVVDHIFRAFPDPNIGVPDPKILLWTPKMKPVGSLGTPKFAKFYFVLRLHSCLAFFILTNFSL